MNSASVLTRYSTATLVYRLFIINQIQTNMLRNDLDSKIFKLGPGETPPEMTGELGQLKDEIESAYPNQNAFICVFICTGPKSYMYKVGVETNDGVKIIDEVTKMKGMKHNHSVAEMFKSNPNIFKEVVKNGGKFDFRQLLFVRNVDSQSVKTMECSKTLKFSSTKRRILWETEELKTVPYGYVD